MWDENPPNMPPPITVLSLIIINVIVFMYTFIIAPLNGYSPSLIIENLGLVPLDILTGHRLYTVITSMFLHASLTHILGNMLYLYVFGDNVEAALGRKNFLILYFVSGIGATIFHLTSNVVISPRAALNSLVASGVTPWEIPAVGASGAISGVLAAYLLLFPTAEIKMVTFIGWLPVFLRLPASVYILIWFVFQLVYAIITLGLGVSAGIAFWAHIGGFISGLALAPRLVDRDRLRYLYLRFIY